MKIEYKFADGTVTEISTDETHGAVTIGGRRLEDGRAGGICMEEAQRLAEAARNLRSLADRLQAAVDAAAAARASREGVDAGRSPRCAGGESKRRICGGGEKAGRGAWRRQVVRGCPGGIPGAACGSGGTVTGNAGAWHHVEGYIQGRERLKEFVRQVKNPYCFRVGNVVVKNVYSNDGVSLRERFEQFARTL